MISKASLRPVDPPLDRAAQVHAITGFRLLRQLGVQPTIILPLRRIDFVGAAEVRERADEIIDLWGRAMCSFASWAASALDEPALVVGTEIFGSDDGEEPPLFLVRQATLEEAASAAAQLLRSTRGLQLRRHEANSVATAIDGLTQTLAAERAARQA